MANYRFNAPFSMRDTGFFFGNIVENDPGPTVGLPVISNSFSVEIATVSRVDFSGEFFSDAVGNRKGTITAARAGEIIDNDDGDATDLIGVALQISNLDASRSAFDNLLLSGSSLQIFSLLGRDDDGMIGSTGSDEFRGFGGDDTMFGRGGNDSLSGGFGEDIIKGGTGADNVNGGSGDDILRGNGGFDTVIGGTGEDNILGGGGQDVIRGGADDDTINGNGGADRITGGTGDDIVRGGLGADDIDGGAGDDTVDGGNGTDTITGGAGDDQLIGGGRADVFVFTSDGGDDTVTDYEDNLDKIQIDGGFSFVDIDIDQDGANAVVSFGAATITLLGQDATELTETDFLF